MYDTQSYLEQMAKGFTSTAKINKLKFSKPKKKPSYRIQPKDFINILGELKEEDLP